LREKKKDYLNFDRRLYKMQRISELTTIQPNAPGSITYQNNELKAVLRNKDISDRGNVYVGRGDLIGCEVVVLVLRQKEAKSKGGQNERPG